MIEEYIRKKKLQQYVKNELNSQPARPVVRLPVETQRVSLPVVIIRDLQEGTSNPTRQVIMTERERDPFHLRRPASIQQELGGDGKV